MKKALPYILLGILVVTLIVLFVSSNNKKARKLEERITFRKRDKIPYGCFVVYEQLKHIFPHARIMSNRRQPGYWDSLSSYDRNQGYISVSTHFNATEKHLDRILTFVEAGNDAFISTRYLNDEAQKLLKVTTYPYSLYSYFNFETEGEDSLKISLDNSFFGIPKEFKYPGRKFNAYFSEYDSTIAKVYGWDENGYPNFIGFKAGEGNLYIHLAPLSFSNYFLLHKENMDYYEKALSVMNPDITTLVWDEFFLNYKRERKERDSWLNVLFRYPPLKAALLTAIITLLIFVLLEMRRKQRQIPILAKPRNDSLDFVKTIGRLYYDQGDHRNLAKKMGTYFLEHVRNRYKLQTSVLDTEFNKNLQYKTGVDEKLIHSITSFIRYADDAPMITYKELSDFHKDLEAFYKQA